jgi:hypothetical protein
MQRAIKDDGVTPKEAMTAYWKCREFLLRCFLTTVEKKDRNEERRKFEDDLNRMLQTQDRHGLGLLSDTLHVQVGSYFASKPIQPLLDFFMAWPVDRELDPKKESAKDSVALITGNKWKEAIVDSPFYPRTEFLQSDDNSNQIEHKRLFLTIGALIDYIFLVLPDLPMTKTPFERPAKKKKSYESQAEPLRKIPITAAHSNGFVAGLVQRLLVQGSPKEIVSWFNGLAPMIGISFGSTPTTHLPHFLTCLPRDICMGLASGLALAWMEETNGLESVNLESVRDMAKVVLPLKYHKQYTQMTSVAEIALKLKGDAHFSPHVDLFFNVIRRANRGVFWHYGDDNE